MAYSPCHGTRRAGCSYSPGSKTNPSSIGGDIKVTVLSDKHGQVKLGIDAPDEVEIWREEIYEKIRKSENIHGIDLSH